MKLLSILIFVLSTSVFAERFSMRDCTLLPVTDTVGHALGYRVYERLEEYLKDANWCDYKTTAPLLGIFSRYRERLSEHLKDPKVVRTVVNKLKVGSIFRIEMKFLVNKAEIQLEVLGENGIDLFLKEKSVIDSPTVESVSRKLISWFETYERSIPYDGQVLGVLGDQLTFKIAGNKKQGIGQNFEIIRFRSRRRHKLLNTVVEWNTESLADGKIFNVSEKQALGIVKVYASRQKLRAGDWVKLKPLLSPNLDGKGKFSETNKNQFGKLGKLSVNFKLGSSSVGTSPKAGSVKLTGLTYGVAVNGELWLTRKYFVKGEFSRSIGSLSKESGDPDLDSANISNGTLKIAGGYKYLPMGFFFGPQVDLYAGYASYSYDIERSDVDGFGANSISGLMIGIGGSMPLERGFRIIAHGEIIPFSKFKDEDDIFGSEENSSSLNFKLGAEYKHAPTVTLNGAIEVTNNSAKTKGSISEVTYRDTMLSIGALFSF